nr:HD-GYP domain-containing protein [Wenzhouxiangella sp. XN79A]
MWDNEILIEPQHLQVGHFVARMDRPWRQTPFPLEGAMIQSEDQRSWFIDHCHWLVIDLLRSRNGFRPPRANIPYRRIVRNRTDADNPEAPVNMLRRAELDQHSVPAAIQGHDLLYQRAGALIEAIRKNGRIDAETARLGIRQIAETLEQNIAAMIWLTRIKNVDQYTAEHCVNVAILSMGLAKSLNWGPEEVEQAGLAGLLHDLGKTKLDPAILNKPGRLTPEEQRHVREHARLGYDLLSEDESVHPIVRQAVLEHHERPDGKGYPLGRSRENLMPMAALVSVVDAYDAITSFRPYSAARSHHEALGILWKTRDRQFDSMMVEVLIQFLGWITPGTLVRLTDGDCAVVLKASAEHRLWPVVRRLKADGERYRAEGVIDLADHNRAHPDAVIRVAEVLPDGALDIDLNLVLREAAEASATAGTSSSV